MKTTYKLILGAMMLSLFSCHSSQKKTSEEKRVSVSIAPVHYFATAIGGEEIKVNSLVKAGFSPANYQPTTQQLTLLEHSKAYLSIGGIGFEQQWLPRFKSLFPKMTIYPLYEGIELIKEASCSHAHHHHGDPHIWTSLSNAQHICLNIRNAFSQLDTLHAALFAQRCDSMIKRIQQLDTRIRKKLANSNVNASFAIYHPSLTYFAKEYGLRQLSLEQEGKAPSVAQYAHFLNECKQANVKLVLIQKEFAQKQLHTLSKELGAQTVIINPLAYDWEQEMWKIVEMISHE